MPATTTDRRLLIAPALAAISLLAGEASAANPACVTIDAVPYEIDAPGLYCLASNLTYAAGTGAAVLIVSDDVTVDLGGFTLTGTAGPGTYAIGIYGDTRRGLTVRNGSVRGFLLGVFLTDDESMDWAAGGGHRVSNLRPIGNYFRGIRVEGRGNVIERNQVADTGGTTVFGAGNYAFGIEVYGPATQILSNIVDRTLAGDGGEAVGISVSDSGYGTVVEGNIIGNKVLAASGHSFGVFVGGGSRVLLIDNRFTRLHFGAVFASSATGLYRDNAFTGCVERVQTCDTSPSCSPVIDAGNNN
jgi:hypothetical protein